MMWSMLLAKIHALWRMVKYFICVYFSGFLSNSGNKTLQTLNLLFLPTILLSFKNVFVFLLCVYVGRHFPSAGTSNSYPSSYHLAFPGNEFQ